MIALVVVLPAIMIQVTLVLLVIPIVLLVQGQVPTVHPVILQDRIHV